jgi:hypothetical protein
MSDDFFEGAKASLDGSIEWIGFYMILFGALLIARGSLLLTDPFSVGIGTFSMVVGIVLLRWKDIPRRTVLVAVTIVMQLIALTHGRDAPYPIQQVLFWPAGAWLLALIITAIFAYFAKSPIFNEDLLPVVSYGWTTLLNRLGAFMLMMSALSLLIFFPAADRFDKIKELLPHSTGQRLSHYQFGKIMTSFADDLVHSPGVWGAQIPEHGPSFKDYVSLLVVVTILGVVLRRTKGRLSYRNKEVPEGRIPRPLDAKSNDPNVTVLTARLTFLFTFSASAFLFGIYAPIIAAGDLLTRIQTTVLLAFFLIGGVGAWVAALAISSRKGIAFVVGLLSSTCFVYALTGGLGFLLFDMVISLARNPSDIFLFRVFVQVALGSLLIFTSYAVADIPIGAASTIKYAACTALLVPTVGFVLNFSGLITPGPSAGDASRDSPLVYGDSWLMGGSFAFLALAAIGIPLFGDRLKRRRQSADRLLVVSTNTIALAPFKLGTTDAIQHDEAGICSVPSGDGQVTCLRVVDSEEQLISLVQRYATLRSFITRRPDVIITDLLTALSIIARTRRISSNEAERYRYVIRGMLGYVPWRTINNTRPNSDAALLFPGILSFSPSDAEMTSHPVYNSKSYSIATGYESILRYCQHREFKSSILPEPFITLLALEISGPNPEIAITGAEDYSHHVLGHLANKMPYVVLRSTKLNPGAPLTQRANALEDSLHAGVDVLRRNYHAIDVARGAQIASFLNAFSPVSKPFSAPIIDRALRDCMFGSPSDGLSKFLTTECSSSVCNAFLGYCHNLRIIDSSITDLTEALGQAQWISEQFQSPIRRVPTEDLLYPMAVIWVKNEPGELGSVLSELHLDLILISVVSAGEYGLICLIPRPTRNDSTENPFDNPYELVTERPPGNWNEQVEEMKLAIADHHCIVRPAYGTLIRVRDEPRGLASAIDALNRDVGGGPLNLEGAWAFPSHRGVGYALLFLHESDVLRLSRRARENEQL